MSHLLHNPYNKPSPFDLPRVAPQPLTPPDTDSEFLGHPFRSAPVLGTDALDSDPMLPQASAAETSTPYYRRQPTVSYIHSGLRDFGRERGPQRSLIKWLVVVIPPASFTREHGHLGQTLSSGSPNRLSQGILMPLFPTMSNQLSAIAREFSFPSTAGLCLYLHTNHNGISLYPRITDESWQLLWAHLFDVRGHSMQQPQLPISGQIEFDIDLIKARWFESWVASPRRDFADVPQSVAGHSRLPSLSHWRGDSRTTFLDEQTDEPVPLDNIPIVQQQPKAPRMIPKKLSLLDRFDTASMVSTAKPLRHDSPQSPLSEIPKVLSPIAQEEEPKTARKDVTDYVSAWRQSAKVLPSPLAATGQTSLDAANMPNNMVDIPTAVTEDEASELNLDDYAWSVSSLGPADYDVDDGYDSESWRLPSPDLARRQLSDAPPTPTTATSWGAPLSYPPSPIYAYSEYAPSLNLADRAEFSRPVTPATATSWGPPSYPQSPVYATSDYAPSVDLAGRATYSRPVTPMTATSWGAPSYLASPVSARSGYAASVDLGGRAMSSRPATPSTATSWGAPSYPASPVLSEFRAGSPDLGARMLSAPPSPLPFTWRERVLDEEPEEEQPDFSHLPSYRVVNGQWAIVWPSGDGEQDAEEQPRLQSEEETGHPSALLVFPYYSVRERIATPAPVHSLQTDEMVFPYYKPVDTAWKRVWPYQAQVEERSAHQAHYPYFNLYPAVYPAFDLYPRVIADQRKLDVLSGACTDLNLGERALNEEEPEEEPDFSHLPSYRVVNGKWEIVWPSGDGEQGDEEPKPKLKETGHPSALLVFPYYGVRERVPTPAPAHHLQAYEMVFPYYSPVDMAWKRVWPYQAQAERRDAVQAQYPYFNLYPAVYPAFDLYPAMVSIAPTKADKEKSVVLSGSYAAFNLYPAVYPHFDIYPAKARSEPQFAPVTSTKPAVMVKLTQYYPFLDLYPAVYPASLDKIYPDVRTDATVGAVVTRLASIYSTFHIYPAVYPYSMSSEAIYPVSQVNDKAAHSGYPHLDIYPSVHNREVKSSVRAASAPRVQRFEIRVKLASQYPAFDLYPAVYPHNLGSIYPTHGSVVSISSSVYPTPAIYPAVHKRTGEVTRSSDLASQTGSRSAASKVVSDVIVALDVRYPHFDLYPATYPHNAATIYPSAKSTATTRAIGVSLSAVYPSFDLYPAVYPHNLNHVYPKVQRSAAHKYVSDIGMATRTGGLEFVSCSYTCPYTAVDPFLMLHPELADGYSLGSEARREVNVKAARYPVIDIYPAVYPSFDIYPQVAGANSVSLREVKVAICEARYPALEIYPAVYPVFRLYPEVVCEASIGTEIAIAAQGIRVPLAEMRYPTLEIYPAVYPHFSLYPVVSGALAGKRELEPTPSGNSTGYPAFNIYPAIYPHFSIYPSVWIYSGSATSGSVTTDKRPVPATVEPPQYASRPKSNFTHAQLHEQVCDDRSPGNIHAGLPRYAARRKPRFTHAQLCDQVFDEPCQEHTTCDEEELWEMITPSTQTSAPPLPVPAVSGQPHYLPRRQPRCTHAQLHEQVFAHISSAEARDTVAPLPEQSTQSFVARSRPRSGSIANRPIPPPKPVDISMLRPPPPPTRSTSLLHPSLTANRLSIATGGPSSRPTSVVGLPSHPAAMRRASSVNHGPRPISSVSPSLRTVPEPGHESSSLSPHRRLAAKDSLETMRERPISRLNVDVRKTTYGPHTSVDTVPPTLPEVQFGNDLGRSNSMPTSNSSIVMQKARAFNQTSSAAKPTPEDGSARITMTALSKFPTPPRPPLPNAASPGRPVSKLDRSKFPFV